MIKVDRPAAVPPVLLTRGVVERRKLCRAYLRAPDRYGDGRRTFVFDREIYGHDAVKTSLRTAQHDKCAFCESHVTHIAYGDVEHFRPKAGFRQSQKGSLVRPGYYWLAYEWENLFFACQLCNQRHKQSELPLSNPAKRARCHRDDISLERTRFIDPAKEDPATSLSFRQEVPFPKNKRGRETIRALGLERKPLQDRRKERLDLLRANFVVAFALSPEEASLLHKEVLLARDLLRRAVTDAGEYAAMIRAAVLRWEKEYGVRMV